jgi:predicted N-acetyltransferase YhbS
VSVKVRPAEEPDYQDIYKINREAFGGNNEAMLVANLRSTDDFIRALDLRKLAQKDYKLHFQFRVTYTC